MSALDSKIINATKWSAIAEIIAKLITPITNMILARILVPEAFGVVATINMIISFADMFTDAGFQKYLVQHEFKTEKERILSINVAFWTNLFISISLWLLIIVFSDKLAIMVGNPGLGKVISIACIQLPLTSFSSIQMAIYRRNFDFKTLFLVRIIGICLPFIVTIPLAFLGYSYWALIIGTLCGALSNAIILTMKSSWKPKFKYSTKILREMISFSIWSLVEAIAIWLTSWIDTFIIGSVLSSYYLGIYKTSLTAVNAIFMLVTASTTPILFSALSRVQNDKIEFNKIFFSMQKIVAYLVLPLSIGIFIYSDLVVSILMGSRWSEANNIVGIWALISGIVIVLGHYSSEVYRSKGKPKLSFIAQVLHIIVLVPTCIIASRYGFYTLVIARALIRLELVLVHIIIMKFIIKMPIINTFKNISIPMICAISMGIVGFVIKEIHTSFIWQITSILICIIFYFTMLILFKKSRNDILGFINKTNILNKLKFTRKVKNRLSDNI